MENQQLIQLHRNGHPNAADMLIEKNKTKLYRFCCHLSASTSDAEDLFQDTWVKAFRQLERFDTSKPFEPWLLTIAVNTYKDRYRKAKRWLSKLITVFDREDGSNALDEVQSYETPVDEQVENKEAKQRLHRCIAGLDDIYRIPLILFYYRELSCEEIAQILNIPTGTVKSRLNMAKSKLKNLMEVRNHGRCPSGRTAERIF